MSSPSAVRKLGRRRARHRLERCPSRARSTAGCSAARRQKSASSGGIEEQRRVAALELDRQLVDIGFAPAEAGRQRQRHRPGAGIDRAEEGGGEFGAGFGDQRDPVARLDAQRDEAARVGQCVVAQLGIGIGPRERAAGVVEIEPATALGGIIERFADRREVGEAARLRIERSASRPAGQARLSIVALRSSTPSLPC